MKTLFESLQEAELPRTPTIEISDYTGLAGKQFAQAVLNSEEFKRYISDGIKARDLPPAVLCRLIDHGWGKPVERVELNTNHLENISAEQLEARAAYLEEMARRLRGQDDEESGSVH